MRETIFFEDRDRERFLEILKRTKVRYGYQLHGGEKIEERSGAGEEKILNEE